jgi:hypothetical protein
MAPLRLPTPITRKSVPVCNERVSFLQRISGRGSGPDCSWSSQRRSAGGPFGRSSLSFRSRVSTLRGSCTKFATFWSSELKSDPAGCSPTHKPADNRRINAASSFSIENIYGQYCISPRDMSGVRRVPVDRSACVYRASWKVSFAVSSPRPAL